MTGRPTVGLHGVKNHNQMVATVVGSSKKRLLNRLYMIRIRSHKFQQNSSFFAVHAHNTIIIRRLCRQLVQIVLRHPASSIQQNNIECLHCQGLLWGVWRWVVLPPERSLESAWYLVVLVIWVCALWTVQNTATIYFAGFRFPRSGYSCVHITY